ncbi:NADP-dependent oxidoreductase domain-containing protein [Lipomyces tetrasporus]|uniref:NADP-dependent oxidoreductase domain-containing protein n=1 Tax=Lipomyces tetrasporus TaxID=54092 RepID=A0AAD7QLY5_9ASCO|nr:NADP-dependent oxidoreductase domain-containing protein [Lipomyces tetrasporus]KAJ8097669.1 NADP-dependent oxidoreductase domain-containing protein [Lipomyces tetrasporus]
MSSKIRTILGCMTFGPANSSSARVTSLEDTKAIFKYFNDRGYSEIDTARVYTDGEQEGWTSAAGYKTEYNFHVATKCYPAQPGMHSASELPKYLQKSLAELKTDSVDIFYLHAPDRSVPFLETLKKVDKLYKEGKFKIFGLSNYTAYEVAEIVTLSRDHGLVCPTLYQARYNAMSRDIEDELVPALRHYGLDLVVFSPLAGGLLSGKYTKTTEIPETGRFSAKTSQGALYRSRYFKDVYWDAVSLVQPVAEKHGLTLLEIALRWLVHHSQLKLGTSNGLVGDGIIIGVSSLEQLQDNINAIESGPLPEDVVVALDAAWKVVKSDVSPYWNGKLVYSYDQ